MHKALLPMPITFRPLHNACFFSFFFFFENMYIVSKQNAPKIFDSFAFASRIAKANRPMGLWSGFSAFEIQHLYIYLMCVCL